MPELPEVETIRNQLAKVLPGLILNKLESLDLKTGRYLNSKLLSKILKQKTRVVERRAKVLLLKFTNNYYLAFHLKMTGQVILKSPQTTYLPNQHTRAILHFTKNTVIYFQDMRKFGWLKILGPQELVTGLLKEKLGPEPFSQDFSPGYFQQKLSQSNKPVKTFLLDQSQVAGIGNIYANEALFLSKINPQAKGKNLCPSQTINLYNAIKKVLQKGIDLGGASDNAYLNAYGGKGQYQEHFLVYRKKGQSCPRCKALIKRIALGGRGTFYCPACQK